MSSKRCLTHARQRMYTVQRATGKRLIMLRLLMGRGPISAIFIELFAVRGNPLVAVAVVSKVT